MDTNESATTQQNSDFREHSKNSLENAAGEAQEEVGEQRSVQKTMDPELHSRTSEYRELSQKSWSSKKVTGEEWARKLVHQTLSKGTHPEHSENREHSQNSRKKQVGVDIRNVKMTVSAGDNQCSAESSDFREHSQNSQ